MLARAFPVRLSCRLKMDGAMPVAEVGRTDRTWPLPKQLWVMRITYSELYSALRAATRLAGTTASDPLTQYHRQLCFDRI